MKKSKHTFIASALGFSLLTGSIGVYAGTVLERYKTPRGNIATVEPINVHKNRIGLKVNGKIVSKSTWYADGTTYVPMRDVAQMLGASVNYDSKTMSANIVTQSDLLTLLGLKVGVTYYGHDFGSSKPIEFKLTSFDPATNDFTGELLRDTTIKFIVSGKISENTMIFKETTQIEGNWTSSPRRYELNYNGNYNEYAGGYASVQEAVYNSSPKIYFSTN